MYKKDNTTKQKKYVQHTFSRAFRPINFGYTHWIDSQ